MLPPGCSSSRTGTGTHCALNVSLCARCAPTQCDPVPLAEPAATACVATGCRGYGRVWRGYRSCFSMFSKASATASASPPHALSCGIVAACHSIHSPWLGCSSSRAGDRTALRPQPVIRFPNDQFGNRIPLARKSALRLEDFRAISFSRIAKRSSGNRMTLSEMRVDAMRSSPLAPPFRRGRGPSDFALRVVAPVFKPAKSGENGWISVEFREKNARFLLMHAVGCLRNLLGRARSVKRGSGA